MINLRRNPSCRYILLYWQDQCMKYKQFYWNAKYILQPNISNIKIASTYMHMLSWICLSLVTQNLYEVTIVFLSNWPLKPGTNFTKQNMICDCLSRHYACRLQLNHAFWGEMHSVVAGYDKSFGARPLVVARNLAVPSMPPTAQCMTLFSIKRYIYICMELFQSCVELLFINPAPLSRCDQKYPDRKVHGANMGPIWGRKDPDGPNVCPMNLAIWVWIHWRCICQRGDMSRNGYMSTQNVCVHSRNYAVDIFDSLISGEIIQ